MKKRSIKMLLLLALTLVVIASGALIYVFNKPHRNVQNTEAFAEMNINDLLNEFSTDPGKANKKYLSGDGNSKVLIVEGPIYSIKLNRNNEQVIVLKNGHSNAGVSCTIIAQTNERMQDLKIGETVKIKGAITAGNSYDPAMDLYTHAILVQCDILKTEL